jgi:hypothetical protein
MKRKPTKTRKLRPVPFTQAEFRKADLHTLMRHIGSSGSRSPI